mgnify:CR=1 FL=1|jgi:hypothetical protein
MDITKSYDFFKPETCSSRIHIIGCGAVGSTVAENLVRFGLTKITLYDFDTVEPHNIANQMFRAVDIGKPKVEALAEYLCEINPDVKKDLRIEPKGYTDQPLSGYVILCVDNIDLRRAIATRHRTNPYIRAMFDYRIRMTDAQHYAADWSDPQQVDSFIASMEFSHEEAKAATPVSACNVELSVVTTIRTIVAMGIQNFIEYLRSGGEHIKKLMLIDMPTFAVMAF